MNAVILAGGFGSRLKPLTDTVPKPMLPIANTPMLDHVLSHLHAAEIADAVLTLGYMPEQIQEWVRDCKGLRTHCVTEDVPLGTAGGVRAAQELLDDTFIVVSGDALENVDFAAMQAEHKRSGRLATMAVTKVADPRAFGLVEYDQSGAVTSFLEKPTSIGGGGIVNCGIYMLDKEVLGYIPHGKKFDFARDLFPVLTAARQLGVYYHDGYWSDVGSPQAYLQANLHVARFGAFFRPLPHAARCLSQRQGAADPSLVALSALVAGRIAHCVIGENAAVASDAVLRDCVVLPGATVRGRHFGEILGDGYALAAIPSMPMRQETTGIYKNLS